LWSAEVREFLGAASLQVPDADKDVEADRAVHSEYFPALIADMQEVAQLDPEAQW
jgi:1,2-phenylacetyl-CoA epoxidase catalytic subunit